MNERELFKIEARKIGVDVSEVETPMGIQFKYGNTGDMFLLWQASVNRQGYKLVPIEATEKMVDAACETIDADEAWTVHEVYKAMIGVVGH